MKILAIELGRAAVLTPIDEVIPIGGINLPEVCNEIVKRYSFLSYPDFSKSWPDFQEKGLEFKLGTYKSPDGKEHNIQTLTILNFGFVVTGFSTEAAQGFLEDLFAWGEKKLKFRLSDELKTFYLLSQIIVQFDTSIDNLIKGFALFSDGFADQLIKTYGIKQRVSLSSFNLDYDRTSVPDDLKQLSPFLIQRQIDKPFSSNRYFSQAPLHTKTHIILLEGLEALLK